MGRIACCERLRSLATFEEARAYRLPPLAGDRKLMKRRAWIAGTITRVLPDGSFEPIPVGPCDIEIDRPDVVRIHWIDGSANFSKADVISLFESGTLVLAPS